MSFDFDILGIKKSKKRRQRDQLEANKRKGRAGENEVRIKYAMQGYEVSRTGKGSDLQVIKSDFCTGKVVESKKVEVKTGNAKLSKLQRKAKPKVERVNPLFY